MTEEFSTVQWDSQPGSPVVGESPYVDDTNSSNKDSDSPHPASEPQDDTQHASTSAAKDQEVNLKPDAIYFNCSVTEPQKEDGQNPYVSYLVTTKTNSPSFQAPVASVRRRFSDFLYLYTCLQSEFPGSAVPPLPDKQRMEYLKGDRFGPEFTLRRASSLGRFLTRVARHPVLKKSKSFYTFLEPSDWNAYKKSKGSRLSTSSNDGVFDGLSDTLLNAFSKVQVQSKELNDVKQRATKLDDNLGNIEKTYSKVVRHQHGLANDLEEFASQTLKLAGLEPQLHQQVQQFAEGLQHYAVGTGKLKENVDSDYVTSLNDMENYILSLKALIKQREQKQLDYEALCDYLNKAQAERNLLQSGGGTNFLRSKVEDFRGVDHEQSRQERIRKLDIKIDDLTREVASAKVMSESFEEYAVNEVAIFEQIKAHEMKDSLSALCDYHVEFYQSMLESLQNASEQIQQ